MMLGGILSLILAAVLPPAGEVPTDAAAATTPAREAVAIDGASTSLIFARVTLELDPLEHDAGAFRGAYAAKVRPFSFFSETGSIEIVVSEEQLTRLAGGEAISFAGRAVNRQGDPRAVSGRAVPDDRTSGQVEVRVRIGGGIELGFQTRYRFTTI